MGGLVLCIKCKGIRDPDPTLMNTIAFADGEVGTCGSVPDGHL